MRKHANEIEGRHPLLLAAMEGDHAQVQALIAGGADVNTKDKDGDTALMFACFKGDVRVVKTLLANNADVEAKANNGWTALKAAESKLHREIMHLLKRAGATE
jgi:ankyrin repeat protein